MPIRRIILDQLSGTVRSMLAREVPERVLFMTGEAGIGKSTLIKQLMADLESDAKAPLVAIAECSTPVAGSSVGYVEALKPFADIMAGLVEAGAESAQKKKGFKLDIGKFFVDTAPSWIGLIPVIGAPIFHALTIVGSGYDQVYLHNKLRSEGASAASNQEQVFRQYINFISKLSSEVPVLVILDDFHWADTSSTNLLFAAARDLAACQVVFLVVYRPDDIKRSAHQDAHALLHVRDEIERYSMSREIVVPPADQADLQALIQAAYPEYTPNEALELWLLRITDGNLLFATQFLSALEHEEYLKPGSAVLLKDLATVPVPSSANAVVVAHIRRLNEDDKEQLRYASVEGETITAHMVSRFLDMPMIKMVQRLRVLADQHHVIRSLGSRALYSKETTAYQFVHFLVHKALYDDLAKEERAMLHGIATDVLQEELASAEEAQHNVHIVAARLAVHATIVERFQTAAEALLKGARWVWRSFAADEALYLLDECQTVVHTQKKPPAALRSVGLEALLLKARIYEHRARYTDAEVCYEEAIALGNEPGLGTPAQRSAAYAGLSAVKWVTGSYPEAESIARVALQIATEAIDTRSSIRALRIIGNSFYTRGMYDQALDYIQQSRDASIAVGDESGRAWAVMTIGNVYGMRGLSTAALEHHQEALSIHRALLDTAGITMALMNIGSDMITIRMFDSALEICEEALKLAQSSGDLRMQGRILHNMGAVSTLLGRFDEALDLATRSLAIGERIGDRDGVAGSLLEIGDVYRATERLDEAIDYFSRCMELANEMDDQYTVALGRHYIGRVHLLQNKPADALLCFEGSRHQFAELGITKWQLEAAFGCACCSLKLDASQDDGRVTITASELREKTRALVRDEDFTVSVYENIVADWLVDINKCGITLEA